MTILLSFFLLFTAFADDTVPVEFEMVRKTCLSKERLWQQLELAMKDSSSTWLWPKNRSSVLGEGLFEDALIEVTYKSTFSSPTYTYEIKDLIEGESFRYQAVEGKHPFEGGADIVVSQSQDESTISWSGVYLTEPSQWLQRRFFKSYERSFFSDLTRNIKRAESNYCQ